MRDPRETSIPKRRHCVSACDGNTDEQTTTYYDDALEVVVQLADSTRISLAEFQADEENYLARSNAFASDYATTIPVDSDAPLVLPRPVDD